MKIALIGYGKMGHAIERIARARGHEITVCVDADNRDDIDGEAFASSDVAIEFTIPSQAADNCLRAMAHGVPVVSGTTGWKDRMADVKAECEAGRGTVLWSSNYSLGVNLFFALNRYLASMMASVPEHYAPSMTEIHHIHKLDHPSGTAITLAEGIIESDPALTAWTEDTPAPEDTLPIEALREGEVPGTHIVRWDSAVDTITIEHSAKSREGFALGAVIAAEWVAAGRHGWLTMNELMDSLLNKRQ